MTYADFSPADYSELHRLASKAIAKQRCDHTLSATALVHEVFLKLRSRNHCRFVDRDHFISTCAQAMRHCLVDYARRKRTLRRGMGFERVSNQCVELQFIDDERLLRLNEALVRLEELNERHAKIVELRFFGGLTNREIASSLGISVRTVQLQWRVARAWLHRELDLK